MSEKKKTVSLLIDSELWKQFKVLCTMQDRTINEVVAEVLEKFVKEGRNE